MWKDYGRHQPSITPTTNHNRSTGGGGVQTMPMPAVGGRGVGDAGAYMPKERPRLV